VNFDEYPRLKIGLFPTPLQPLENLSNYLGGPKIWIKRDDLCGIAFGGNKIRKLEYILYDVIKAGYNTIVTAGGPQSNHTLLTAGSARKVGLDYRIIALSQKPELITGNLVTHQIYRSKIVFREIEPSKSWGETALSVYKEIKKELEKENKKPVYIPVGGSIPVGALGYCRCVYEIKEQSQNYGFVPSFFVLTSGSMGTITGIILGKKLFKMNFNITGISVFGKDEYLTLGVNRIEENVVKAGKLLDFDIECSEKDYTIFYDYTGPGYGSVTPECVEAIKITARTEGIILGPVYSGKAMAGLIDLIKKGYFNKKDNVVFLHSGGSSEIFAKYGEMVPYLD